MMDIAPLREFLDGSQRNAWVKVGPYEIYLRVSRRSINGLMTRCVDLANVVNVDLHLGYGGYWVMFAALRTLACERGYHCIYLENTHNKALYRAYEQRGCIPIDEYNLYRVLQ